MLFSGSRCVSFPRPELLVTPTTKLKKTVIRGIAYAVRTIPGTKLFVFIVRRRFFVSPASFFQSKSQVEKLFVSFIGSW